jgi:hemerythrin-like domain-containing protein
MTSHNDKGRTAAILLGGIAGGIIGGRLLPPLVSALISASRTRAGCDPFALLMDDHRRILSLLDEMATAPSGSRLRRGRLFLALKRKLAKHAMAEEDVVYPIVRKERGSEDPGMHLYEEHADMKTLLYEIESQLMAGQDWGGTVGHLRDLIRSHIDEEENTVFPALRRQVAASVLPKLSGQISREEALVI